MNFVFSLGVFVVLMLLGFAFGKRAESQHYKSIKHREDIYRSIVVLPKRFPPPDPAETYLVTGSVVISVDYFKRFLASLRMIFGGRLNSYESLLDRARREAILRLQEKASKHKATHVYNVRFETSSISKGQGKSIGSIEILAYGTAVISHEAG